MKSLFSAVLALTIATPVFAAPALERAAADVAGVVKGLKKEAAADKSVLPAVAATNIWHETSCMDVVFEADQGGVSNLHILTSKTWIEECRPIGHPHGGCIPQRRAWSHAASFDMEILGRGAPAPREVFKVCMNGPWLQEPKVKESPYRYQVSKAERGDITRFTLRKKADEK